MVLSQEAVNFSDATHVLRTRAPRIALAVAGFQTAYPALKRFRERVQPRYTVKVLATDSAYEDLHEWVLGLLPSRKQEALVAYTGNGRMRLKYDGTRRQWITFAGHSVEVVVTEGESSPAPDERKAWKPPELLFSTRSHAAQQQLLAEIAQIANRRAEGEKKPTFRMLTKWGDWERLDELPDRTSDSVILPEGQLEGLLEDVRTFLGSEDEYLRRCIPWHRGHLYEGPPGTGKTSVARAIASHFGLDVWYLPLADLRRDADLINAISRITPHSMLLLEDVDVFHAATQRDDDNEGVTLSGLLNALDGIATPHGLFTVMTTNTPDVLDDAVMRPGRVDRVEHFGLANADQTSRLLTRWYGTPVETALDGLSPAQITEVCKRHEDGDHALQELWRLKGGP